MSDLDYTLLDALKNMSGGTKKENQTDAGSTITSDSEDIEILDYIIVFLCSRIKSINVAFKGGYVLMKTLPGKARYSHDIDFSISSGEQYEIVKEVLNQLGNDLVCKNIISRFEIKDTITPTSSGGIKLIRDYQSKSDLGIDIGWHDLSYGVQSWSIFGNNLNKFTVERMLADKLSAIYSRKRFRRAKDLYDVYIITNSCNVNTDSLLEYVSKREVDWNASPFQDTVIEEYSKAYDKLMIKNCAGELIDKPTFGECMMSLSSLVKSLRGE